MIFNFSLDGLFSTVVGLPADHARYLRFLKLNREIVSCALFWKPQFSSDPYSASAFDVNIMQNKARRTYNLQNSI